MTKTQFIIQATKRITERFEELKGYYSESNNKNKFNEHVFQYIFDMYEINELLKGQAFMDDTIRNEYLSIINTILTELEIVKEV